MRVRAVVVSLLFAAALLAPSVLGLVPSALAASVTIALNCNGNPETTKISNNSGGTITIKTVGSLYQPRSNEPFTVNARLAKGASITYQTGAKASSHVLTHQYIYSNVSAEGARVVTSIGTITKKCF